MTGRPSFPISESKIEAGSKSDDIVGSLDFMATFAKLAGLELPKQEGKPIIFDSHDMSPILLDAGKSERINCFYFTESKLSPGAVRFDH